MQLTILSQESTGLQKSRSFRIALLTCNNFSEIIFYIDIIELCFIHKKCACNLSNVFCLSKLMKQQKITSIATIAIISLIVIGLTNQNSETLAEETKDPYPSANNVKIHTVMTFT